jgi:hypothetical protein
MPEPHETQLWAIAIKGDQSQTDLKAATEEFASCYAFKVPGSELRVGTLDSLMSLSDDLAKMDIVAEATVTKVHKQLTDLMPSETPTIEGVPVVAFTTRQWEWNEAKFQLKAPLRELAETISLRISGVDDELKLKVGEMNAVKGALQVRRAPGSHYHDSPCAPLFFPCRGFFLPSLSLRSSPMPPRPAPSPPPLPPCLPRLAPLAGDRAQDPGQPDGARTDRHCRRGRRDGERTYDDRLRRGAQGEHEGLFGVLREDGDVRRAEVRPAAQRGHGVRPLPRRHLQEIARRIQGECAREAPHPQRLYLRSERAGGGSYEEGS